MIVVGALVEFAGNGVNPVDGGVAIWIDGEFVFGAAEERFTRKKYAGGFRFALRSGLEYLGISYSDVDVFSFVSYGEPFSHQVDHILRSAPEFIPFSKKIHVVAKHHEAHALCAARLSPFDTSLVAVLDNEGQIIGPQLAQEVFHNSMERASFFLATENSIDLLTRGLFGKNDISLGEAYRRFSYYCGFPSHQFAGKTMALAPYGNAHAFGQLRLFSACQDAFKVYLSGPYDKPAKSVVDFFKRNGILVSPARKPDGKFEDDHLNAAAFVQAQLEEKVTTRLRSLLSVTGQTALCLAGGVAYNCHLIAHLEQTLAVPVFVPPSPGDQGLGIGAIISYLEKTGVAYGRYVPNARLGGIKKCNSGNARSLAKKMGTKLRSQLDLAEMTSSVVEALCSGAIVAIVDGKSEYGRRALGARSLLSLPVKGPAERLRTLKNREWFRPFGATMLRSLGEIVYGENLADSFMMRAPQVQNSELLGILPHIDGTLRAQIVDNGDGTLIGRILHGLVERGLPSVVLNTSFNLDGDPLVETEEQAIDLFVQHDQIDVLALADSALLLRFFVK